MIMRTGDFSKKYGIEEPVIRGYVRDIRKEVPEFAPKDSIGAVYKGNDAVQMDWMLGEIARGKKPRDVIPVVIKRLKQGNAIHVTPVSAEVIPSSTTIQTTDKEQRIIIEVIVKLA
ncbi:hypothetical protein [Lysinibacillus sp. RC79]|uniref:hypothetical protein n=1 Tax=Lysinibacillus sp. RC79 TaxID=3156296 RepID=UPI0035115E0A